MTAKIIDGRAIAKVIRNETKNEVGKLTKVGISPCLAAILVGDNAVSEVYIRMKRKACEEVGITSILHRRPGDIQEPELLKLIGELNNESKVHGILVQLPLPSHIDERKVIESVSPLKDVDGFHPANVGKLVIGLDTFKPCTPAGIQEMLVRSGIEIEGKHIVIVGRSNVVGKPMVNILLQKAKNADATVTVCHSRTRDLPRLTKQADILIAAMGKPHFIKGHMVKQDAVVVDVGVSRVDDPSSEKGYKLAGDVDIDSVVKVASAISPVPGGVGPMTVAMLMVNTLKAIRMVSQASNL